MAAAEGGIDGFWLIIAADLKAASTVVIPFNIIVRLAAFAKASASQHQISLGEALAQPGPDDPVRRGPSVSSLAVAYPAWFLQGWRWAWPGIAVRLLFQPLPALRNLRVQ